MNANDPNVSAIELVAIALGPLIDDLVLVGGCAVGLLMTDLARPANRETKDVDLVAEVASILDYYSLSSRIKERGFLESEDHICRWVRAGLVVDVMPTGDVLGGSTNRWYPKVITYSETVRLPRGTNVRLVSAPLFIATKLEAFHGRGEGDFAHHDIEDIVNLIDGRPELAIEIKSTDNAARTFIEEEFEEMLANQEFTDKLHWHLNTDADSQARLPILIERMRIIAGL